MTLGGSSCRPKKASAGRTITEPSALRSGVTVQALPLGGSKLSACQGNELDQATSQEI